MSKKKRVGFKLDMTPMVDVGFLLLTFFMLSTTFKAQDVAEVIIPESHSAIKLPDSDVMTVTVNKDGEVYLSLDNQNLRAAVFGPQYILKVGMIVTLAELPDLLRTSRIRNPKLRTVIKADQQSEYRVIQSVMEILQKEGITRFNLVTNMEK
jgi:biopolymer transport protein ExbD